MLISIVKLRLDGGTQPRVALNFDAVDAYMDDMERGANLPPVEVWYDGQNYWLVDGFHRLTAHQQAGREGIECDVHQGTLEQAQWRSFSVNQTHGLRRTNEDKHQCVQAALLHPMSLDKSDTAIAKHVGVSQQMVSGWREKLEASHKIGKMPSRTVTRNGATYQQNTTNIGRKCAAPESEQQEIPAAIVQPKAHLVRGEAVVNSIPASVSTHPPQPNPELESTSLMLAIFRLADHKISAAEMVSGVPEAADENVPLLYQKSRAALEFVGFVFEAISKRHKKSTGVA